jgi:3-methyl-2-oxobutanoate hydroxymethyltransferase
MEHHVRAVARAQPKGLIVADLPYHSYENSADAVHHARRLLAAGADAVKAEGGQNILPQVQAIMQSGIPFMGHLGMLPQHVLEEGGYKIKGKQEAEKAALLADAAALADLGAFAIVLELVTPPVAAEITRRIAIPTIGIGSGHECDGQVLVTHDLTGSFPWFTPKFAKRKAQNGAEFRRAVLEWKQEVESRA